MGDRGVDRGRQLADVLHVVGELVGLGRLIEEHRRAVAVVEFPGHHLALGVDALRFDRSRRGFVEQSPQHDVAVHVVEPEETLDVVGSVYAGACGHNCHSQDVSPGQKFSQSERVLSSKLSRGLNTSP